MGSTRVEKIFGLPWYMPPGSPLTYMYKTAALGVALQHTNMEALFIYKIPTENTYAHQVSRIIADAWEKLPLRWKANSKLLLRFSFHPDNPALTRVINRDTGVEESVITYSSRYEGTDRFGHPIRFKTIPLANMHYYDMWNTMAAMKGGIQFSDPQHDANLNRVQSLADALNAGQANISDRVMLDESYDEMADEQRAEGVQDARSGKVRPDYLHLSFLTMRYNRNERNGDKGKWLRETVYGCIDAGPGDCEFQAMLDSFGSRKKLPLNLAIEDMRTMCEIPDGGVSLIQMDDIEKKLRWGAKRQQKNSVKCEVGFVVFDFSLNLRRLPEYLEREEHEKNSGRYNKCYLILRNNHAIAWQTPKKAYDLAKRCLTFYEACYRAGINNHEGNVGDFYKESWELFRQWQHLQPDMHTICQRINEQFGKVVTDEIVKYRKMSTRVEWAKKVMSERLLSQKARGSQGMIIEAEGYKRRAIF